MVVLVLLVAMACCAAADNATEWITEPLTLCPFNDSWPCVPKCCHMGESLAPHTGGCQPSTAPFEPYFAQGAFAGPNCDNCNLIVGDPCPGQKFRLEPEERFELFGNGTLRLEDGQWFGPDDFCVDSYWIEVDLRAAVLPIICFSGQPEVSSGEHTVRFVLYPIGLLISVPFLVATAAVYLLIPELRDLHGKALSCHALCLAAAYLVLSVTQLSGDAIPKGACIAFAFLIQFSFLACFSWLSVLAVDTTWNVLSVTGMRPYPRDLAEQARAFVGYSVFGWMFPTCCLVITLLADIHPSVPPSFLRPSLGSTSCWFHSKDAALSYFYGPIGFLFLLNVGMFVISLYKIFTYPPLIRNKTPTERVRMVLMLFVSMGLSWIMELVSWALGGPVYAWALPDIINILQGVILFVIFVLEPSVKRLVLERLRGQSDEICSVPPTPGGEQDRLAPV